MRWTLIITISKVMVEVSEKQILYDEFAINWNMFVLVGIRFYCSW